MISGAQRAAALADHVLVFADIENVAADEGNELRRISAHVDGMVIASARTDALATSELVSALVPTVLLNRRGVPGSPAVVGPDERGATLAAEHLLELRHRRIALLAGPVTVDTATRRQKAFADALGVEGLSPLFTMNAELEVEEAAAAVAPVLRLSRDERPTAIFAAALTAALGVLVAARRAGLRVPDDLSIIGFDDAVVAELVTPGLSTIRMPHEQMGLKAIESLLALLRGESLPETISIPEQPELVIRGTTAPPATNRKNELE
jgi:LacI family transcriptional regulator